MKAMVKEIKNVQGSIGECKAYHVEDMTEMEERLKTQDEKRMMDTMNQHYTRFQSECQRYQKVLELYSNCVNGKI